MTHGIANDMHSGLTQEYLREFLHYDEFTGIFTWKKNTGKKRMIGKVAGNMTKGYWEIAINKRQFKAHRLAWLYVKGEWPKSRDLDHINLDKLDNRISNLREATRAQNNANRLPSRKNTSGRTGVSWSKDCKKWIAYIRRDGKSQYLGVSESFDEICALRESAELEVFGEYARQAND